MWPTVATKIIRSDAKDAPAVRLTKTFQLPFVVAEGAELYDGGYHTVLDVIIDTVGCCIIAKIDDLITDNKTDLEEFVNRDTNRGWLKSS